MSIHVLPTAPSPTVTHFMNFEALEAIDWISTHTKSKTRADGEEEEEESREINEVIYLKRGVENTNTTIQHRR